MKGVYPLSSPRLFVRLMKWVERPGPLIYSYNQHRHHPNDSTPLITITEMSSRQQTVNIKYGLQRRIENKCTLLK